MATKWVTTTVVRDSPSSASMTCRRQARRSSGCADHAPAITPRNHSPRADGSSLGDGISPTAGSTRAVNRQRRSSGIAVSRVRRSGLLMIGRGPSGARRSAIASAWAAPYHFASTMNHGERAITIDEVPLEWCFQPGIKLDFRALPDGYVVTARDVEAELKRIGHTLHALDIVVVNTRAGAAYGKPDYVAAGAGMGREATLYLLERGVRVTGTDAWSWDAPFVHTKDKFTQTGDPSLIWEGHKAGREIGYCHLEKLHNLEALPAHGFTIACFPVKIRGASAGWTRAVGIL